METVGRTDALALLAGSSAGSTSTTLQALYAQMDSLEEELANCILCLVYSITDLDSVTSSDQDALNVPMSSLCAQAIEICRTCISKMKAKPCLVKSVQRIKRKVVAAVPKIPTLTIMKGDAAYPSAW